MLSLFGFRIEAIERGLPKSQVALAGTSGNIFTKSR